MNISSYLGSIDPKRYRTFINNYLQKKLPEIQDMQFIYVLPGWEGSAHDGRVLRDAVTRRTGLKVPQGNNKYF